MIGQDLRYKKRFVPLARARARPYGILSPGLRTHGDQARIEGVFAAGPVPNYGRKGFGGPFFFPGRISSKGPASMRDASDLRVSSSNAALDSRLGALHLSLLLPLCPLDSETFMYVSPFFFLFFFIRPVLTHLHV